jgi:hypothetical protein
VSAGPWRILVLDRNPQDPMWVLATVAAPDGVRPAPAAALGETDPVPPGHLAAVDDATRRWVASAAGLLVPALYPVRHPAVWRVEEGGQR